MEELQYYDSPTRRTQRRSKKWILLIFILLLLLLLGVGGYFLLPSFTHKTKPTPVSPTPTDYVFPSDTPTPSVSVTPSPSVSPKTSPSPTVKVTGKVTLTPTSAATSATITVENGSGTVGAAGKMSTYLKGLGYTVSGTGNAATFDYSGVTIQVKKSEASILPKLKKDVAASYTVTSATADLPASASTDAVVIVGK